MGQALYRQYRPKSLDEVVGQDHITTTIKNALKSGKLSHAYLFTGPKGVGKTSVARILAHEINQFPYDEATSRLDIIEIDAASNRRIDEIRDLRDKVHIAPSSGKYKVYIIDEVHMLTKEAFNALLKTLEEPPAHVIFILATTESHKLPDTIISRTQRFSFKPIDRQAIIDQLKHIAQIEKIKVEDDALGLVADHSEGSFRDSISMLDQASSNGPSITAETIQQMLGLAPSQAIERLVDHLSNGGPKNILADLTSLEEQGYQAPSIAKQLSQSLRSGLVNGASKLDSDVTIKLLEQLIDIPASPSPDKLLEVRLLDIVLKRAGGLQTSQPTVATVEENSPPAARTNPKIATPVKPKETVPKQAEVMTSETQAVEFSLAEWPRILDSIKVQYNTLYGILRMGQPMFDQDKLTLAFKFSFHQKRVNEPRMRQLIASTFANLGIKPVTIEAVVDAEITAPETEETPSIDVSAISNIFGDAEVLES